MFDGILTIVRYSILKHLHAYIEYMMRKHILFIYIQMRLSSFDFFFFTTVKKFQVLLYNTNNSIQNKSFVRKQLSDSKYCYI